MSSRAKNHRAKNNLFPDRTTVTRKLSYKVFLEFGKTGSLKKIYKEMKMTANVNFLHVARKRNTVLPKYIHNDTIILYYVPKNRRFQLPI